MTVARWITTVTSGILAIIFAVLFFHTDVNIMRLILFFFFFLCFFHIILALWVKISRRIARGTDYIYFSFVLVGLIVAFLAQENSGALYYEAVAGLTGPRDNDEIIDKVNRMTAFCDGISQEDRRQFFAWVLISFPEKLDSDTCSFLKEVNPIILGKKYSEIPKLLETAENKYNMFPRSSFHFLSGNPFFRTKEPFSRAAFW
jgi:hypothetical protein